MRPAIRLSRPSRMAAFFALALLAALLAAPQALLAAGVQGDPMVKITSLPLDQDLGETMAAVSKDVARDTGLPEGFVTYYWGFFESIHCPGCQAAGVGKPLFVDLHVPGFMSDGDIQQVMTALAEALARHTPYAKKDLFIQALPAAKEHLFINGGLVTNWKQVGGPDDGGEAGDGQQAAQAQSRLMDNFLFNDPALVFQSLWRVGLAATGASDLGEALMAAGGAVDGDHASWYRPWRAMAERVEGQAREFLRGGHEVSAREAFFRASNYYRAANVYVPASDPNQLDTWQRSQQAFQAAAALTGGLVRPVKIPYEDTHLAGYWCVADGSGHKRPTLVIQTGLDGMAEDLYFIMAVTALKRGYNCLVFDGPGQGEAIIRQKLPFRHDWEKVITPVTDFVAGLPEADAKRLGLVAYSMGGYLAPRALAFEHRYRCAVVDGGVYSVFDGTMTKFDPEVRRMVARGGHDQKVNKAVQAEMEQSPDVDQFINQMLWTFQKDTPAALLTELQNYSLAKVIGQIETEILVVGSTDDQVAGSYAQAQTLYNKLQGPKAWLEFGPGNGAQFHCQLGAPMFSGARILNWLDERLRR